MFFQNLSQLQEIDFACDSKTKRIQWKKSDQHLIDADGCAYVTRDCVCAWTFSGKWDTQILVQRHTQSECADSNYVA